MDGIQGDDAEQMRVNIARAAINRRLRPVKGWLDLPKLKMGLGHVAGIPGRINRAKPDRLTGQSQGFVRAPGEHGDVGGNGVDHGMALPQKAGVIAGANEDVLYFISGDALRRLDVAAGSIATLVTGLALRNQPEFTLVDILDTVDNIVREVNRLSPNIILLDSVLSGQPTLDIMDELAAQFPEAAIIAILTSADPAEAQQVMLAGARAFIIQPFTQINLLSTLRRVHNLETRRAQVRTAVASRPAESTHPVRVITVFSPRGGSGTSTVAANLAIAIQNETGMRTLLLEGKLFFGYRLFVAADKIGRYQV